jgi:hypothetical protein
MPSASTESVNELPFGTVHFVGRVASSQLPPLMLSTISGPPPLAAVALLDV